MLLAVASLALFAGCGGDDETTTTTTSSVPATTSGATGATGAAGDLADKAESVSSCLTDAGGKQVSTTQGQTKQGVNAQMPVGTRVGIIFTASDDEALKAAERFKDHPGIETVRVYGPTVAGFSTQLEGFGDDFTAVGDCLSAVGDDLTEPDFK